MGGATRHRKVGEGEELDNVAETAPAGNAKAGVPVAESDKDKPGNEEVSDLTGEYGNIFLLVVLYTLQGIPMGLAAVLPMILKERGVSFSDLATFSLNSYPFSLKLLWAPIVDAAYVARFGRRKTWMVPAQLLIGAIMFLISTALDDLLFVEKPQVTMLTGIFFLLYFLCATQDIAVDGWALTMLRRENVGYAATCNSIGQTLGYAVGFTGFMVLEHFKVMTLAAFMRMWGVVFVAVTVAVALLKTEGPEPESEEPEIDVPTAYKQMLSMIKLRAVRNLIGILFTWKAAFAIVDGVAPLKIQEYGMPKEHMAYITSLIMPVYILLPVVVARYTSSSEPFELAMSAYKWRVAMIPTMAVTLYFFPASVVPTPWGYYGLVFFLSVAAAVASQCMFVSQMAFFARISDPAMGGTYMTMLNTLANLGGMWPGTVTLKLVDMTTCKDDTCSMKTDGFYVLSVGCLVIGLIWCALGVPASRRLQQLKLGDWRVR